MIYVGATMEHLKAAMANRRNPSLILTGVSVGLLLGWAGFASATAEAPDADITAHSMPLPTAEAIMRAAPTSFRDQDVQSAAALEPWPDLSPVNSALIVRVKAGDANATAAAAPVLIALYSSEYELERGDAMPATRADALTPGEDVMIDVPVGAYALRAFRDLNGNGQLDTGLFGRPTEPVFYSNRATSLFGVPNWDDTRFRMTGGVMSVEVDLD